MRLYTSIAVSLSTRTVYYILVFIWIKDCPTISCREYKLIICTSIGRLMRKELEWESVNELKTSSGTSFWKRWIRKWLWQKGEVYIWRSPQEDNINWIYFGSELICDALQELSEISLDLQKRNTDLYKAHSKNKCLDDICEKRRSIPGPY